MECFPNLDKTHPMEKCMVNLLLIKWAVNLLIGEEPEVAIVES